MKRSALLYAHSRLNGYVLKLHGCWGPLLNEHCTVASPISVHSITTSDMHSDLVQVRSEGTSKRENTLLALASMYIILCPTMTFWFISVINDNSSTSSYQINWWFTTVENNV